MKCEFITKEIVLKNLLSANNVDEFKIQFKNLLDEAFPENNIVYVFKTQNEIPRLRGKSNVVYIGKTKNNLYSRYIGNILHEAEYFWPRYHYIISNYGSISIKLYVTSEPEKTESRFLHQYNLEHMELPPLNLKSYQEKNL